MFCSCYRLVFFTLVILKGIDSKTKQDGHLVDKNGNRFRGTCDNYHEFECQWNGHCPGKCDDNSSKAGNYCKNNISCPNGKCIRNTCIKPTGVCSNDSNETCKKNKDCRPHKCVIPTGFCEDDPAVSCEGRIDCPGTCVQSSNSKRVGIACTKRGQCGKNGKCHRSRCVVPLESATPSDSPSSRPNHARQPSNDPSTLPTTMPSSKQSDAPSTLPSTIPSSKSSDVPSTLPSTIPSSKPSDTPSALPSKIPSSKSSDVPSDLPSTIPSSKSSDVPLALPSTIPSSKPSDTPSASLSAIPRSNSSDVPSALPSTIPSSNSSDVPSALPSTIPSNKPSDVPSALPSTIQSSNSSDVPSALPSTIPSSESSDVPLALPSTIPSIKPSDTPSALLSAIPHSNSSNVPSALPSTIPRSNSSDVPSASPSTIPSSKSSDVPSALPSTIPSSKPSDAPSALLSAIPRSNSSDVPSALPSTIPSSKSSDVPSALPSAIPSSKPSDTPSALLSTIPRSNSSDVPSALPSTKSSSKPSDVPSALLSVIPRSNSSDVPSALLSAIPRSNSSDVSSTLPSTIPSSKSSDVPSTLPSTIPSSKPSDTPKQPSIEEALLNDKLFGPSSNTCINYVPKDGEYSFTFDLKSLPYFDSSLAEVEEVKFQVHISHTDSNEKRNWSIKLGTGGDMYSFKGPYGESIPPNTKKNMQFVDEVNQKVCVDSAKNQNDSGSDNSGSGYFIHQAGVYQNGDPGYTDQMPFWFSPNVSIYCSTTIPECRMASWGQQSYPRPYTERIIYYDRYRDCGDGILERTHIIHNAETKDSDTLLTFTNMPWGGTRYSTLKDFVFSQSSSWNYAEYNLPGGIEDPMRIFVLKPTNHKTPTPWTLGYTIFAQDLPYVEYPNTPLFEFPGRLPKTALQPVLTVDLGTGSNKNWICQGPMNGYDPGTYRCRFKSYGDTGTHYSQGCHQCDLRITNPSNGKSFGVFNIRHWKFWEGGLGVHLMYLQTLESKSNIDNVCTLGSTLTVAWDEVGKSPEENLALSFVHGTSQQMIDDNRTPSRMRFGHSNSLERDFAVLEYISFPNLRYGDSFRARQYYVTDGYAGLGERSEALADDTIEEVITSGELELSQIQLHYSSSNSASFGASMDGFPCNNAETTTVACAGSTTPQLNKDAFLQITCGSTSYVGTDFYHFSNYPNTPHRPYTCKVNGVNTSDRPTVKLLGYFGENDCGDVLQDKVYDANFCSS